MLITMIYYQMSLILYRDLKFLKLLIKLDTRYSNIEISTIKQILNSQIIKYQLANPFLLHPYPEVTIDQIPNIILFLAKQMEEVTLKNLSLANLEHFVTNNYDPLVQILTEKTFHCQVFCQALLRLLQEYARTKEFCAIMNKVKLNSLIDLLIVILQRRKNKKVIKPIKPEQKESNRQIHTIFLCLKFLAYGKYVKEPEEVQIQSNGYMNRALLAACLLIEQCQREEQFQGLRDFLSVASHLLIFNSSAMRPLKWLDCCLDNNQGLYLSKQYKCEVSQSLVSRFIRSLNDYSKLDFEYQTALLKMARNLLSLNVNNEMLIKHFDILVQLIRCKLFPSIKKLVFDILIETQNKRNIAIIDEIFIRSLTAGADILDDDVQRFNLILAESGESKRKEQFSIIYYYLYEENSQRIHSQIINFIFQTYLDQNLPLQKIDLMIIKEANIISSHNIKKLHEAIQQQSLNIHISLVSIILEKRRDSGAFKVSAKKSSHPFMNQDWLLSCYSNVQVYKIYLKIIADTLFNKSLQVYPSFINIGSCIVKIQGEYLIRSMEFYLIILKAAEKNNIFDQVVFRYMLMMHAVMGDKLPLQSFSYFSKNFVQIINSESTYLTYLEYLVTLLKNKSSVLLYLSALLQFSIHLQKQFFEKRLFDISFLSRMIEESEFFRISTFSIQAVAVLYELSLLITDQSFQQDFLKIMKQWSRVMSRSECTHLAYFFIFRQIKKIYPFLKERKMKNKSESIKMLWNLILNLIDHDREKHEEYINMSSNKMVVEWRGDEMSKRGINICGTFIRNYNMEMYWHVCIETQEKVYSISINNDRIIIEFRRINQQNLQPKGNRQFIKQQSIKQLKKRPESIQFQIRIESQAKKLICHIKILQFQIEQLLDGNVQEIRIGCKNNAILKNIKFFDGLLPGEIIGLNCHLHNLNRWQVKIATLNKFIAQPFRQKFDYDHAYCCIGEMLRNFPQINLPFAYDIFVKISNKLIKQNEKTNLNQLQLMIQVFNTIVETLKGKNCVLQPSLQCQELKNRPLGLYYLLVSAILPLPFWCNFTQQTRQRLTSLIQQLLQTSQFRQIQNSKLSLFDLSLQISKRHQYFFSICQLILSHHDLNGNILSMKFKKFVQMAKQSQLFQKYISGFLHKIIEFLNIVENQKYIQNRLRSKLLIESHCITDIFPFCTMKSKLDLLHYFSQNPSFDQDGHPISLEQIKQLVKIIEPQGRDELIPWLITEVQQLIFKSKTKALSALQSKYSFRIYYMHLELLIINKNVGQQQQKQNLLKYILQLLQILKQYFLSSDNKIKLQLQTFFSSQTYFNFIIQISEEIMQKYGSIKNSGKKDTMIQIYEYSMKIICRFQKKSFLQFMIRYRCKCSKNWKLLKALIEYQQFKRLKLWQVSIFLQYLFQILLIVEYQSMFDLKQCHQLIHNIYQYLQFVILTLDKNTKIPKSLFYNYPKLICSRGGMNDTGRIMRRVRRVQENVKFIQLKGGIYFKCVLIIIKLMKINPNQNYQNLIKFFLLGPKTQFDDYEKQFNILTRGNIELYTFSKERSTIEAYVGEATQTHKDYYIKQDNVYAPPLNEEIDLNGYVVDYFLMNIAEFLQQNAHIIDQDLLKTYSYNFLLASNNQKIGKQLLISSGENYEIVKYDDIKKKLQSKNQMLGLNRAQTYQQQSILSPIKNTARVQSPQFQHIGFRDSQFLFPPSPKKQVQPRRRTQDFSDMNKRSKIFEYIKNDCKNWYKRQECKSISSFFCQKAKDIRIIQLLHTHYVLKNHSMITNSTSPSRLREGRQALNMYQQLLKLQKIEMSGQNRICLEERIRKVKKIQPYTSPKQPVLKILQNTLPNMTCPITLKIIKQQYSTRHSKNHESIYMKFFFSSKYDEQGFNFEEEGPVQMYEPSAIDEQGINEEIEDIPQVAEQTQPINSKDKHYCELITREGAYFCQFHFQKSVFVLETKTQRPKSEKYWYLRLGSPPENLLPVKMRIQIHPSEIVEIFQRRFNQITNNSLQFFMKNGTSRFVSFFRRQLLASHIKYIQRLFRGVKLIKDPVKQFEDCKFSQKWIEGHISNFDYLMLCNKYSGRTYNDLNQYYVFPWVLQDYNSQKIDLSNFNIYRDLSKPIGAINPAKLLKYLQKYKDKDRTHQNNQKCIYGSHYSTSLFVFYYLIRLQPFSSLHRDMQKGHWDVADRLFSSVGQVWESLMNVSNTSDIKQCIPEFYYMPAFLKNVGNIQFGQKQCGSQIDDVQLPPWAQNAQQFIVTMRAALQSDYVSENLHSWIDLIFGKHQNSQQKHNIFLPCSYSDPDVLKEVTIRNHKNIEGIICQIYYFGQCPIQLFKKEHKAKKTFFQIRPFRASFNGKSQSTQSQNVCGQASLMPGWKIIKVYVENTQFILDLENVTRQERSAAVISAFSHQNSLKQSLENLVPIKKSESKVNNEPRVNINNVSELSIGKQFLFDLNVKSHLQRSQLNQLWIACFGCKGIKIYNWQLQKFWSWQNEQVKQVHLQSTRMIFSTPNGKLYFYSFLDRKIQEIVVFKDICDMAIKVIALPRLPFRQNSNQSNYKILCIGDALKISIVSFSFEQTTNYTSHSRSLII